MKSIHVCKVFFDTLKLQVGWETLSQVFRRQVETGTHSKERDTIFDNLKDALVDASLEQHHWDGKALDYLHVIQLNAMEDRIIPDRRSWEQACSFMATTVDERLADVRKFLDEARGPSFVSRWLKWKSTTNEQNINSAIQKELIALLNENPVSF